MSGFEFLDDLRSDFERLLAAEHPTPRRVPARAARRTLGPRFVAGTLAFAGVAAAAAAAVVLTSTTGPSSGASSHGASHTPSASRIDHLDNLRLDRVAGNPFVHNGRRVPFPEAERKLGFSLPVRLSAGLDHARPDAAWIESTRGGPSSADMRSVVLQYHDPPVELLIRRTSRRPATQSVATMLAADARRYGVGDVVIRRVHGCTLLISAGHRTVSPFVEIVDPRVGGGVDVIVAGSAGTATASLVGLAGLLPCAGGGA